MMDSYAVVSDSEDRANGPRGLQLGRILPLRWDTNTALAVIVLGSTVTIMTLRGSLKGGAVQP